MVDYSTLSIVLTGIGLIAAITHYSLTLRDTSKARQRDLVFQRLLGFSLEYTKTFAEVAAYTDWEDVEDWQKKYGILTNPEAFSKYAYIWRVYNLAGILLKEKVADVDLILKLYPAQSVISVWEQFEPIFRDRREKRNHPAMYEPFEFLYNEAKKRYPEILPRSREWENN